MRRFLAGSLALLLALAGDAETLRIHGSNTVGAALAPALIRGWLDAMGYEVVRDLEDQPLERLMVASRGAEEIRIDLHSHGSSTGFLDVIAGEADLAMSSRPIRPEEAERFGELGGFDPVANEHVLALDGIAAIVHPDNPLRQVRRDQLAAVFSGRVRDWSALGWGDGGAIRVYARDAASGTFDTFRNLVLGSAEIRSDARLYESNSQLSDDVSADRRGIGFVSLPNVRSARPLAIYGEGTVPLTPSSFTVATEDYALARRLYFYLPQRSVTPLTTSLIEFTQSPAGQSIAERVGYVSQQLLHVKPELPPDAPADYRALVAGAERLSVNIRFRPGATRLDSKAERDLERIRAYLDEPGNERFAVMLLGFADARETTPAFAQRLSLLRAEYIAGRMRRLGVEPTRIRGYGQAMPVAENGDDVGRQKNRRVEIWIYDRNSFRPPVGMATG